MSSTKVALQHDRRLMKTGIITRSPAPLRESTRLEIQAVKALSPTHSNVPKYRQIYDDLLSGIRSGVFQPGERLPSEAELGKQYETSRITVAKAVNELQLKGLVTRRPGSGTHVLGSPVSAGRVFGLLIPDLGRTEIF
jgi:hypothetical protein